MQKIIRVDVDVFQELLRLKAVLIGKTGKNITSSDAIKHLINIYKPKKKKKRGG